MQMLGADGGGGGKVCCREPSGPVSVSVAD